MATILHIPNGRPNSSGLPSPNANARMVELRNQMREFAELVGGRFRGHVVADLLISSAPSMDEFHGIEV